MSKLPNSKYWQCYGYCDEGAKRPLDNKCRCDQNAKARSKKAAEKQVNEELREYEEKESA